MQAYIKEVETLTSSQRLESLKLRRTAKDVIQQNERDLLKQKETQELAELEALNDYMSNELKLEMELSEK